MLWREGTRLPLWCIVYDPVQQGQQVGAELTKWQETPLLFIAHHQRATHRVTCLVQGSHLRRPSLKASSTPATQLQCQRRNFRLKKRCPFVIPTKISGTEQICPNMYEIEVHRHHRPVKLKGTPPSLERILQYGKTAMTTSVLLNELYEHYGH